MRAREQGDTIVEVLFAVAVFAIVAVGGMAIMNQGTAVAQRSLEVTQVRQQIDAQAEAIRYIHQAYVATYQKGGTPAPSSTAAQWVTMTSTDDEEEGGKGASTASDFGELSSEGRCPSSAPGERPFILNARKAEVWGSLPTMTPPANGSLPPYAYVDYNGSNVTSAYGIWIEAIPSESNNGLGFVDFHIRACWDSAGSSVPTTLGTIVRLYEPR